MATAMAKSKHKAKFAGRWLIESMTMWDRDFIDEEVRGYFEFEDKNLGFFQFGYVKGQIHYRIGERDGKPLVEFSWKGYDEMDPVKGRGWLVLEGDELKGMFYFHLGDESGVVLKWAGETRKRRKR
jgi:hypothetical protein